MLTCIYVVEKIDGDYAELRRVDALKHDPEETRIKYQREQIYQF